VSVEVEAAVGVDEALDDAHELGGGVGPGVDGEEAVLLAVEVPDHDGLPSGPEPGGVVDGTVVEEVAAADDDQGGREVDGVQRRRARAERVGHGVVGRGALRQRQAPVAVVEGTVEEGVGGALGLRPRARHAAEEWHELDVSPHGDGGQVRGRAAEAHGEVVRDGAAGRVARHEDAAEVGGLGDPGVPAALPRQPQDRRRAVVDGGGEAVLGREAVVRRHHERAQVGGQAQAVVLAVGPGAGPDAEAAAVVVEEDRQAPPGPGPAVPGEVEAERQPAGLVERHVLPVDRAVVPHRCREPRLRAPHHRAVAVHEQHAPALVHDDPRRGLGRHGWVGAGAWLEWSSGAARGE
jgi:hypothetical protein